MEIVNDKHLRVWYKPRMRVPAGDTAAIKERELAMERFHKRNNMGFPALKILEGNIGYLNVVGFGPVEEIGPTCSAAMAYLAHTDALIIDLRANGGGEPAAVQYLASYFFDGKAPVHLNSIYNRGSNTTEEFWVLPNLPGSRYLDKPVYVLTSSRTFSGGEELAYDLQTQKRATLIGETTGGGANPCDMVELPEGFGASIPTGRAINPVTKTNWEGTGVIPDIKTPAANALAEAHRLALNTLAQNTPDREGKDFYMKSLDKVQAAP